MAALVIAKRIGVVATENFERLPSIAQIYFGDATRTRFAVGDHGLPIWVQVVVSIGSPRSGVISPGIARPVRRTPATKTLGVIVA